MAKGNLFLGTARGKLGDVVLARRNGKQTSRPYLAKIANPRTTGQNYQRMVFATAAAAASALNGIIDHSFEGIKYGQDSRSYFMKEATKLLRGTMQRSVASGWAPAACGSYVIKGAGVLVPNFFKVSKGTLTATPVLGNLKTNIEGISNALVMQSALQTATFGNNAEEYAAALRAAFGCDPGDQMTFIFCGHDTNEAHAVASYNGENNYQSYVQIARVIFKPFEDIEQEGSTLSLFTSIGGGTNYQINPVVINERSINAADVLFKADGSTTLVATGASPITIFAAAIIRSKLVSGSWLRSNAFLSVNPRAIGPFGPDVVGSYGNNAEVSFSSDRYLNNAVPAEQAEDTATPAPSSEVTGALVNDGLPEIMEEPLQDINALNVPEDVDAYVRVGVAGEGISAVYVGMSDDPDFVPIMTLCSNLGDGTWVTNGTIHTPDAGAAYLYVQALPNTEVKKFTIEVG